MANIRQAMKDSPWIGWALAAVLLGVAVFVYMRRSGDEHPNSPDHMREMVTIKFADTGDEVQMPRGRFERQLCEANAGELDPAKGIINPKTNQPTGFLFDKTEWESTIKRINTDRKTYGGGEGVGQRADAPNGVAPKPPASPAPPAAPK